MTRSKLAAIGFLGVFLIVAVLFQPFSTFWTSIRTHSAAAAAADTHPPISVLFIGNSYTFFNNLPRLVSALSMNEDRPLRTESVTQGGYTLEHHWQDGKALAAIQQGGWDYVVLQEHSTFGDTAVVNGM